MIPATGATEVLRPSPGKWLAMVAISGALVWIGTRILGTHPLVGWSCIVLFGLCGALAVLNLVPGASRLVLDADGFEIVSLFRRTRVRWPEVSRFGSTRVGMHRLVGFDFVDGHAGSERLRRVNRNLSGFQAALPDTYGRSAGDLAAQLDARLAAHRAETLTRS
ncbi:PH domain-containing protein [Luteimonas kalidii]|uniref:PH domain-containing protein n=1 Tax=Luteimonas kalidii TaxID=3042025 RepID=A0ABT6JYW0_9GAMM|nr:PH domain-containing protein [Luteimonas kalidii]MDH5835176.1 PH domain-containing protein [Luteimonas kalidii]